MYRLFLASEYFARSCHCVSLGTSCRSQDSYRDSFLNDINPNRIFEILIAVLMDVHCFNMFHLSCSTQIRNTHNQQCALRSLWCILFTKFTPTCFGRKFEVHFVDYLFYEYSHSFFFETSVVAYQWALYDIPEDSNLYHPKYPGIYGLFDDSVGGLLCRVSNGRIINRQWIGTVAA
jgi:hypothetical protein